MGNQVFMDENIIHAIADGDQTSSTVKFIKQGIIKLVQERRKQNKLVLVMGEFTEIKHHDSAARKEAIGIFNSDYDKFAVCGRSPFIRTVASFIIKAVGKGSVVKIFDTKEKAVGWLKE